MTRVTVLLTASQTAPIDVVVNLVGPVDNVEVDKSIGSVSVQLADIAIAEAGEIGNVNCSDKNS